MPMAAHPKLQTPFSTKKTIVKIDETQASNVTGFRSVNS